MKRILLIVGGLVAVVVVALVIFLFTGLGAAIKAVVEGAGSAATGTDVKLASANVSLTSGDGTLKGLVVGNPKGFSTPSAIELGQIHVSLDTSTVASDTVVIKQVLIEGPQITYEVGTGGSNIGVIQDNVAAFSGGSGDAKGKGSGGGKGSGAGKGDGSGAKQPEGGKKVIIEDLVIRKGRVEVSATFLQGKKLGAELPEIHLTNIGKAEGGATAGEVAKKVLAAITDAALGAAKGLNVDGLAKGAEGVLGGAVQGVKDIFGGKKK